MAGTFLPLLVLFVIYAVIGSLNKAAKKSAQGQKTAPRKGPAAPADAAVKTPAPEVSAAPGIHELQPTVRVTEHDDTVYRGSLNAVTGEGYDPCHDEQLKPLTQAETFEPAPAAAPGLRLNWSGDEIVRGFVVSEILKRKGT